MQVNEAMAHLNAKRTALIAGVALAFQAANVLMGSILPQPLLIAASMLLVIASAAYLTIFFGAGKKTKVRLHVLRRIYRAYGFILALCMLPFFLADAGRGAPVNSVLFYAVFMFAPLFSFQENKGLFFLVALYPALAAFAFTSDWPYALSVMGLGVSGALLSYSLHNGYLDIIASLRIEGDIDDLTKLFNRKAGLLRMSSLLALCKRMGRPAAAFYIDIDCFKSYNDTFGHLAGDHALMEVAACMRRCFARETDVLARLGGEEFAVLIPVAKTSVAVMMAKRLIHMVSDMGMKAGKYSNANVVTVSIGVAVMEEGNMHTTVQSLMDTADKQLYIAKTSGRNCIACGGKVVYKNAWA